MVNESNKLGKPQNRSNSIKQMKKANTLTKLPKTCKEDENIYALASNEPKGYALPFSELSTPVDNDELDNEINRKLMSKGIYI
jgi:hypothetical protein